MLNRKLVLLAFVLLLGAGCHTMRFEVVDQPHDKVVYDRKAFFFWGLTPTQEVDVRRQCPGGVVAIKEATTFSDGLFGFFTLGIYSPRSSWYYCYRLEGKPK